MKVIFVFFLALPTFILSQFKVSSNTKFVINSNSFVSSKELINDIDSINSISSNGFLILNATQQQALKLNFAPKLHIVNSGGVLLTSPNAHIKENLKLENGILTTNNNIIHLHHGGIVSGNVGNSAHVDGWFRKHGNTAFNFPVGDNGIYAYIGITAPSYTTDHFTAKYINQSPATANYTRSRRMATLHHVSHCEYWMLNRTGGTSNVQVRLSYQYNRSCIVNDLPNLKVARWNGTLWEDEMGTPSSNDTMQGFITSQLITSFSPFTLASTNNLNPLPVVFKEFKANCTDGKTLLKWITESELNNMYFDIYSSQNAINWEHIARVPSQGNSSLPQSYEYLANQAGDYYKLEQTDVENIVTPLKIIKTNCIGSENSNLKIWPKPAENYLYISNPSAKMLSISIYDNLARKILEKLSEEEKIELDISAFRPGIYSIKLDSNEKTFWEKILKK